MTTVKAYAIHSIGRRDDNGKKVLNAASTKDRPSIVELDKRQFDDLFARGAVREATKEEIAVFKVQSEDANDAPTTTETIIANAPSTANGTATNSGDPASGGSGDPAGTTAPDSGAEGDPKGKPKGATVKGAAKADEEI